MKKRNIIILSGIIIITACTLLALKTEEKTYDYMYIIQTDDALKIVSPNNEIQTKKLDLDEWYADCRPALNKVKEMEKLGWELYSNSIILPVNRAPINYFLMRKTE